MTIQEAQSSFRSHVAKLKALHHAMGILSYDGATTAPEESAEGRGRTLAYLSGCAYALETDPALLEAARFLEAHGEALSPRDRREIQVFLREQEYTAAIPQAEYVGYVTLLNRADAVWHRAKLENDFAAFAPLIREIFDANVRFAKYYRPDRAPYDTQLSRYERGLTMERTDAFFNALKERIVPLLKRVMAKPQLDDSFLWGKVYPTEVQRKFTDYLLELITVDRKRCGVGETEHPFTTFFNKKDVRVTTHYHEENPVYSMYSVIHEGGHALYELHSADELEGTLLSGGVSMSIHESQSRFMEISIVDCTGLFVFVPMAALGLTGQEDNAALEQKPLLLRELEYIRGTAAVRLGLAESAESAAEQSAAIPKLALVGAPAAYSAGKRRFAAEEMDLRVCMMTLGKPHKSFAVTGAMCAAGAAAIPGSVVHGLCPVPSGAFSLRLGNPAGIMETGVRLGAAGEILSVWRMI